MWPVHALLMGSAVISMFVAAWAVTLGKHHKGSFRIHKTAAVTAFVLLAAGLTVAAGMVQASGGPHFRVLHGIFGAITIAFGLLTGVGGLITTKVRSLRKRLRPIHVWAGRIAVVLFVFTILAGLRQAGIL
ncbi:MAG: cytochrome b family protein [Candidatus Cryosericum sp.]